MKTIDLLFEERQLSIEEVAEMSKIAPERMLAIADGRWTPSPSERARIAQVFGIAVDEVSWGHTMDPRNIRYHRFGFKENI